MEHIIILHMFYEYQHCNNNSLRIDPFNLIVLSKRYNITIIIQKPYCVDLDYNETLSYRTFWFSGSRIESITTLLW